jgi:hypothetical protein
VWNRFVHAVWAAIGGCVSVLLIFTGGGHPPPIVFLPVVVVVWIVGHVAIWGTGWLVERGRHAAIRSKREHASWPVSLRLVLVGTGVATCVGLLQIAVTVLRGKLYPFHGAMLWTAMLAIGFAHGACFAGLLLRRPWSRFVSMLLVFAWAFLFAAHLVGQVIRGHRMEAAALALMGGAVLLLLWLGFQLATSSRVKAFFGK